MSILESMMRGTLLEDNQEEFIETRRSFWRKLIHHYSALPSALQESVQFVDRLITQLALTRDNTGLLLTDEASVRAANFVSALAVRIRGRYKPSMLPDEIWELADQITKKVLSHIKIWKSEGVLTEEEVKEIISYMIDGGIEPSLINQYLSH
ncbi:MAG: hypothetical protein QXI19_03535 [Candidatus Caldarchaeum sp.]